MPQSRKDVLTLLAATEEMAGTYADRPIITMSMAKDGVIQQTSVVGSIWLCADFRGGQDKHLARAD